MRKGIIPNRAPVGPEYMHAATKTLVTLLAATLAFSGCFSGDDDAESSDAQRQSEAAEPEPEFTRYYFYDPPNAGAAPPTGEEPIRTPLVWPGPEPRGPSDPVGWSFEPANRTKVVAIEARIPIDVGAPTLQPQVHTSTVVVGPCAWQATLLIDGEQASSAANGAIQCAEEDLPLLAERLYSLAFHWEWDDALFLDPGQTITVQVQTNAVAPEAPEPTMEVLSNAKGIDAWATLESTAA